MKKIAPQVFRLTLAILLLSCFDQITHAAQPSIPTHVMSLSFDLNQNKLSATSKITLPADKSILLHCGQLEVTGALIEQHNTTPLLLRQGPDNTFIISAAARQQTVYISWVLHESSTNGRNLIDSSGIALTEFWHPIADSDMLFEVNARVPNGFEAISEAEQITVERSLQGNTVHTTFSHPLRSINFVAGPYLIRSRKLPSLTLYTYFFKEDQELASGYLDKAEEYVQRYQKLIGPFPYSRYSIVENRLPTGYGMPTFTLLGQAVVRLPFIKDTSLGHEILHSWFGNGVQVKPGGGNWSEGLTSYLADQLYAQENNGGPLYRKNQLQRYAAYVHPDNTLSLNNFTSASDSQPMAKKVRAVGYDKSSMVFHMLRKTIGDPAFYSGLRAFYGKWKFRRAGWQELQSAFAEQAAGNLDRFFEQWLGRVDTPGITMENIKIDQQKGRSKITFDLVQETERPYVLAVPLQIITISGNETLLVETDSLRQKFSLFVDTLPTSITIDPGYDLFRTLTSAETPATWSRFQGADQKTVILPPEEQLATYQPLITYLEDSGCLITKSTEITMRDLSSGSWLFLGESALLDSLFARFMVRQNGFTLDVRKNPFNLKQVMVIVGTDNPVEHTIINKLRHYGRYSLLNFIDGRIHNKKITPSAMGINQPLIKEPSGMPISSMLSFQEIIADLAKSRVIYVGETHTDYGDHLLQLQIIQALQASGKKLAIGMEMFPRSAQQALDDFSLEEKSTEREFIKASKYFNVWGYDYRLYRDIIGFARQHNIPLVGLNLDKKIVSQVFRSGTTGSLTTEQLTQIPAEINLDVPGYRERLLPIHGQHGSPHGSNFNGFLQAQTLWDETMAESVVNYLQQKPDRQMVIIAGRGHVYKNSAIPLRVQRRMPHIRQSVVASQSTDAENPAEWTQVDYRMQTRSIELEPQGKIGVILTQGESERSGKFVRIAAISPHGKAGLAGLDKEDIILAINGEKISSIADLKYILLDRQAGDTVSVTHLRRGKEHVSEVELSSID